MAMDKQDQRHFEPVIRRVLEGCEADAEALVERLYPLVIKIVRSHRPRRVLEEDLAQTIFATVFAKLHTFGGKAPLEHWVSRIAVNTCLNQLKFEKVRPELRWADLSEEEAAVVETLHRTDETLHPTQGLAARELVDKLLEGLKPRDRTLIHMLYLKDMSLAEVRQATGWSEPVIKVRAFRARRRLRKLWRELQWREDHEPYRTSIESTVKSGLAGA